MHSGAPRLALDTDIRDRKCAENNMSQPPMLSSTQCQVAPNVKWHPMSSGAQCQVAPSVKKMATASRTSGATAPQNSGPHGNDPSWRHFKSYLF